MIDVKIKKLNDRAVIPQYAKPGDAGMDVVATSVNITDDYIEYGTGLAFEVPEGYAMLIFPRSSNSKKDLLLCNSVGVLDSGYRGELKLRFKRTMCPKTVYHRVSEKGPNGETQSAITENFQFSKFYDVGDRVGQIIILPYPQINFIETDQLSDTERGSNGFGSTGNA